MWLRRGALDRSLAAGADPATSSELQRRARKLSSPRYRAGLAVSIHNLLEAAEEPPRGFSSTVPLRRHAILAERELLLEIADDLVADDDLNPRGIALVERLITSGDSPIYVEGSLSEELRRARAALHLA